ncbi:MAG: hypothetical protein NC248_10785 [Bacteroides sp.]|nr:hypothetical protein [Bacteroides sp.]MCM1389206.1 hypothetical protein [Bacteroides sp.]
MTEDLSTDFSNSFPVSFRVFGTSDSVKPIIDKINDLGYDSVSALTINKDQQPSLTDEDKMVIILVNECKDTAITIARNFYQAGVLTLIISTSFISSETSFCDSQSISEIGSMYQIVKSIFDILTKNCYICLDFNDITYTLHNSGFFKIIETTGKGCDARLADALYQIDKNSVISDKNSVERIIISIFFNRDIQPPLTMKEIQPLSDFISNFPEEINAIYGIFHDEQMATDGIRLSIIVSGK